MCCIVKLLYSSLFQYTTGPRPAHSALNINSMFHNARIKIINLFFTFKELTMLIVFFTVVIYIHLQPDWSIDIGQSVFVSEGQVQVFLTDRDGKIDDSNLYGAEQREYRQMATLPRHTNFCPNEVKTRIFFIIMNIVNNF